MVIEKGIKNIFSSIQFASPYSQRLCEGMDKHNNRGEHSNCHYHSSKGIKNIILRDPLVYYISHPWRFSLLCVLWWWNLCMGVYIPSAVPSESIVEGLVEVCTHDPKGMQSGSKSCKMSLGILKTEQTRATTNVCIPGATKTITKNIHILNVISMEEKNNWRVCGRFIYLFVYPCRERIVFLWSLFYLHQERIYMENCFIRQPYDQIFRVL